MKVSLTGIKSFVLGRKLVAVAAIALIAMMGSLQVSEPAHAAIGSITQYTTPNSDSFPNKMALGPDNNIWYTAYGPTINTRVGKMTSSGAFTIYHNVAFASTGNPAGISRGSDGNIWFGKGGSIIKMSTSGAVISQYSLSGVGLMSAEKMVLGADGAIWFIGHNGTIGRITTDGAITTHFSNAYTNGLAAGPDGNIWFTVGFAGSTPNNYVGKISSSGVVSTYPTTTIKSTPWGITTGSDGNLWFTEKTSNKIAKITTAGVITEYAIPTASVGPQGITSGSDGALWFTRNDGKIGHITISGVFTEYNIPGAPSSTTGIENIITGPGGAVWYLDWVNDKIGRVATELSSQTISFTSAAPTDATVGGPAYFPAASASSGLPVTISVDPSSSDVCTIDGAGIVTFPGYGTCTLNANQAGDVDYYAATQVQQSFLVLPVIADTELSMACSPVVAIGSTATCTLTIANNGPAAAENASLTALFSGSLSGASVTGGAVISGQRITWSTPSLASGESRTFSFSATASVAGRSYVNAALLQTSPDQDSANNITGAAIVAS